MKKLIFNLRTTEKRAALIDGNEVVEIQVQQPAFKEIIGNIYAGRIVNVLPGMQAAFVDIGIGKNGYIHRDHLLSYHLSPLAESEKKNKGISEFAHIGQAVIVQVFKESFDNKGPKLTEIIEFPGEKAIYLPQGNYVAVSRKIASPAERDKWRHFGESICAQPEGVILRTACEGSREEEISVEFTKLKESYENMVQLHSSEKKIPSLLHEENDLAERLVREMPEGGIDEIVVDEFIAFKQMKEKLAGREIKLEYYSGKQDIFSFYGLEHEVEKALKRIVWLKSGAYIIIEQTEALTVIDVNTGKFSGKNSMRDTILKTNAEAAKEIARQLRIRDIGGIVVIDFIDMKEAADRNKVYRSLSEALADDRSRTRIAGYTGLGKMELTRKKARHSLAAVLTEDCPVCAGTGRIMSKETAAFKLERELWEYQGSDHEGVWVEATRGVIECFAGGNESHLKRLEEALRFKIILTEKHGPAHQFHIRQFGSVKEIKARLENEA